MIASFAIVMSSRLRDRYETKDGGCGLRRVKWIFNAMRKPHKLLSQWVQATGMTQPLADRWQSTPKGGGMDRSWLARVTEVFTALDHAKLLFESEEACGVSSVGVREPR